jgi:hypothetical protein
MSITEVDTTKGTKLDDTSHDSNVVVQYETTHNSLLNNSDDSNHEDKSKEKVLQ